MIESLESRVLLAAVTWDAGGDGVHWSDANNWSSDVLPGAADDVTINFGSGTVQHDTGTDTVNSLTTTNKLLLSGGTLAINGPSAINNGFTLSGGTLSGTGVVTCSGTLNWTSGTMSGTGTTTIASGAILNIDGGGGLRIDQRTLNNAGTVNLNDAYYLDFRYGSVFNNQAGALFDLKSDTYWYGNQDGEAVFNNAGTFRKSGGTGSTNLEMAFNNSGSVDVQSGTLSFSRGGTSGPPTLK